jgi:hypothetical protein
MKLTLARFGGFAAGIKRPSKIVDSARLPETAARELARLVEAAKASQASSASAGPGASRDAMTTRITIDDASDTLVLSASDGQFPPAFAALRDWLEIHGRGG